MKLAIVRLSYYSNILSLLYNILLVMIVITFTVSMNIIDRRDEENACHSYVLLEAFA